MFKYAPVVEKKVWNEAENRDRDWGLTRPTSFARVRLVRHAFTNFFTDFEKKPTVLQSSHEKAFQSSLNRLKIRFVGPGRGYLRVSRKSMFTNIKSVLRVYDLCHPHKMFRFPSPSPLVKVGQSVGQKKKKNE